MNDPTNEPLNLSTPDDAPLPTGLMMALAQNMHAMGDFAKLSDAGRRRLIEEAAATHSQKEMSALVRDIARFL